MTCHDLGKCRIHVDKIWGIFDPLPLSIDTFTKQQLLSNLDIWATLLPPVVPLWELKFFYPLQFASPWGMYEKMPVHLKSPSSFPQISFIEYLFPTIESVWWGRTALKCIRYVYGVIYCCMVYMHCIRTSIHTIVVITIQITRKCPYQTLPYSWVFSLIIISVICWKF